LEVGNVEVKLHAQAPEGFCVSAPEVKRLRGKRMGASTYYFALRQLRAALFGMKEVCERGAGFRYGIGQSLRLCGPLHR
jgi:hypothetical protein